MAHVLILTLCILTMTLRAATGDEVRHTKFPDVVLGTWALNQQLCEEKDKSNITIAETKFSSADGDCNVQWVVQRAASRGTTYGVHARCVDPAQPDRASAVDFIVWPQANDRISVGKTFDDLKAYQRCPGR